MNYTQDQKNALQIIKDWWSTFNREQCLMLSGAAGTGKTTLISNLPKERKISTNRRSYYGNY